MNLTYNSILFFALGIILSIPYNIMAQEDLMDLFGEDEPTTDYTYATFKTTRISLGQSVENPAMGNMIFDIHHHLCRVNGGDYEFF